MKRNPLDVADGIITYFINLVISSTGERPIVNRGKMKFAIADILKDWKQTEVKSFIEYYVQSESQPDLVDFCRRYDEIIQEKKLEEEDIKIKKDLLARTKESVMEFRERYKGAK